MTDETKNDGGPAFPSEGEGHGNPQYHSPGMTLRDYFAAKAMQGLMADPSEMAESDSDDDIEEFYRATAQAAYEIADAMLSAGKK